MFPQYSGLDMHWLLFSYQCFSLFFWVWACIIDRIRRNLWDGRILGIEMNCMISFEPAFFPVRFCICLYGYEVRVSNPLVTVEPIDVL